MVLATCAALATGFWAFAAAWTAEAASRWLIVSAILSGLVLLDVWQNLEKNHPPDSQVLFSSFGSATLLTISRGLLVAMLAGFVLQPWPVGWLGWLPGGLYWLSNLTDLFDGYVARRTDRVTSLGEYLDMQFDGLAVFVGTLLAVQYGQLPLPIVLAGLARYIFLFGERFRRSRGLPIYPLPSSARRRAVAGVFMSMVGTLLLPIFSPPGTHVAGYGFLAVFLGGFTFDWLIVSGHLDTVQAAKVSTWAARMNVWGALVLRLGLALVVGSLLARGLTSQFDLSSLRFVLLLSQIPILIFYSLGIAGRTAALVHLIVLGFSQSLAPLTGLELAAVGGATLLLFSGTGKASLWTPEDDRLFSTAGEAARP